jgi:BMFP domain-containing protein YqiC
VTPEELDVQMQVLERTREKLDALAVRLARPTQEDHSGARSDPGP